MLTKVQVVAKIIKIAKDEIAKEEIAKPIRNCINSSILTGTFPDELKIADIVPVFKKEDPNDKTNYRPISLSLVISKIFENVLYQQVEDFSNNSDFSTEFLSPKLCGFRKGHSTQHVLLYLLKN